MRVSGAVAALTLFLGAGVLGAAPVRAGGSCHELRATEGTGTSVDMRDNCFVPSVLRAPSGATVRFTNQDRAPHTVTGLGRWGTVFDEVLRAESVEVSFPGDGLFAYSCLLHPGMVAVIVVGDPQGAGGRTGERIRTELAPEIDALERGKKAKAGATPWSPVTLATGAVASALGFGLGRRRRRPR